MASLANCDWSWDLVYGLMKKKCSSLLDLSFSSSADLDLDGSTYQEGIMTFSSQESSKMEIF